MAFSRLTPVPLYTLTGALLLGLLGLALLMRCFAPISPKPGSPPASITKDDATSQGGSGSILQRLMNGDVPKLTPIQLRQHVEARGHSAASLLAAWMIGSDDKWLQEAAQRHPDDPHVASAMLLKLHGGEEARAWIERIKQNDPGNALGYLYAAKEALSQNDIPAALGELSSMESARMNDHRDAWQAAITDAYFSAGHRGLDAEWMGMAQVPLALSDFRALGRNLTDAMTAAMERGDPSTAETLGRHGMRAASLANMRGDSDLLINQLVSVSMERYLLNQLHAFDFAPGEDRIVVDRLAAMETRINRIKELVRRQNELIPHLTDSELRQYTRRIHTEGELKAMEWLVAAKQREE